MAYLSHCSAAASTACHGSTYSCFTSRLSATRYRRIMGDNGNPEDHMATANARPCVASGPATRRFRVGRGLALVNQQRHGAN